MRGRVGASAAVPRRAEAATRRAQLPSGSLAGPGRSTDFAPGSEQGKGRILGTARERGPGGFWSAGLEGSENLVGSAGRNAPNWERTRGLRLPSSWP